MHICSGRCNGIWSHFSSFQPFLCCVHFQFNANMFTELLHWTSSLAPLFHLSDVMLQYIHFKCPFELTSLFQIKAQSWSPSLPLSHTHTSLFKPSLGDHSSVIYKLQLNCASQTWQRQHAGDPYNSESPKHIKYTQNLLSLQRGNMNITWIQ
jgi:hypothetical protein